MLALSSLALSVCGSRTALRATLQSYAGLGSGGSGGKDAGSKAPPRDASCRMIVWGGAATGQIFDDGAEYDPEADTWTPLPSENAPGARGRYSVVWTGREAIFWGGSTMSATMLDDGARYVVD